MENATNQAEMDESAPEVIFRLEDYCPPEWFIDKADLTFALDKKAIKVESQLLIRRNPEVDTQSALFLDGAGQEIEAIELDGAALAEQYWQVSDEGLTIDAALPNQFTLRLVIQIDPTQHSDLMGLSLMGKHLVTQCEPDGFRRITYFTDRPDVSCRFRVRLEANESDFPVLLSNGNLNGTGTLENGRHWAQWDDPWPKPCYLFALLAGPLERISDHVTLGSGKQVSVNVYADATDINKMQLALHTLQNAITWDEKTYGLEYDLDVFNIGVLPKFPFGGMENKGLNLFDASAITSDANCSTDMDSIYNEATVAHEYFHNWTGNRVTIRDWCQLTVKEGVTVHRHQQYMESRWPQDWMRINDVKMLWARQFPEDAGGTAHPARPDQYAAISNFYTATVYEKGAELIRMLRTIAGDEAFHKIMRLYLNRYDCQHATLEQLLACFSEQLPNGLPDNFVSWFETAGTPKVVAEVTTNKDKNCKQLSIKQEDAHRPIPFNIAWLTPDGVTDAELITHLGHQKTYEFSAAPANAVLSINRGYSAPIILKTNHSLEDLEHLVIHDDDGFSRWDALRKITRTALSLEISDDHRKLSTDTLIRCFNELTSAALEHSEQALLLSELLTLPTWGELAAQQSNLEPLALYRALESLKDNLAADCADNWQRLANLPNTHGYALNPQQVGVRALRKLGLEAMWRVRPSIASKIANEILSHADNVTDRFNALRIILRSDDAALRAKALTYFLEQGSHPLLVRNMWLQAQAQNAIGGENILAKLDQLIVDGDCDLTTPSQVRALIGGFGENIAAFHAEDGSGYQWAARWIGHIAEFNDEMAARLVQRLSWGNLASYQPNVRARMQAALETIKTSAPSDAAAVRDICGRLLNATVY